MADEIKEKAKEVKEKVETKAKEVKAKVEAKVKEVKEKVKEAKKEAKKDTSVEFDKNYVPRLKVKYNTVVVPNLMKKYNYTTKMQAPKIDKIVINMGVGDAAANSKFLDDAVKELALITGQRPVKTTAKKSNASFKIREGQAIGCKVTLRSNRMYEFLDKLIAISLPRVRDFRGISNRAFDGKGSYTLGVKEQLMFPEIDYDKVNKVRGMDVVIVTTAKTDDEARSLLTELGMPFHR